MNHWLQMIGATPTVKAKPTRVVITDESLYRNRQTTKEKIRLRDARRRSLVALLCRQPNLTSGDMAIALGAAYSAINNDTKVLRKSGLIMRSAPAIRGITTRYKIGDER